MRGIGGNMKIEDLYNIDFAKGVCGCCNDEREQICLHFRADCGGDEAYVCEECLAILLFKLRTHTGD